MDSKGKVAIISGSSQGIGKTTAVELAKLGVKVVLNGRNEERLEKAIVELSETYPNVTGFVADLTNPEQAKLLVKKTISHFGRLDILINNAGISMRGDFSDLNPDVFTQVFNTNVPVSYTHLTLPTICSV